MFHYDPVAALAGSTHAPIRYWARHDLLRTPVGPVEELWAFPAAARLLNAQRADGSWAYRGGREDLRARSGYDQIETYRSLGEFVEKYGLTRRHQGLAHMENRGGFEAATVRQSDVEALGRLTKVVLVDAL